MNTDFNIDIKPEGSEMTIRQGRALDPKEPQVIHIIGVLDSPLSWLQQRVDNLDQKRCHILVNRNDRRIVLRIDETNHYCSTITGGLELHPMFKLFAINTDTYRSNFDMAQLIKMNRTVFETQSIAMQLVTELQNFRAKVEREIEKQSDNRGNMRDLKAQVVDSNLPKSFNLTMPIFKGTPKQTFEVEVYIKPDDFSCTLVSPVANDLIEDMRDTEIDRVLKEINDVAPGIVIIEQ